MSSTAAITRPFATYARLVFASFSLLLLSACAGTPVKPIAPEVTLAGVRPVNLSLTEQTLMFTLRVKNPNSFKLPIETLDFRARFSEQNVATGKSASVVTVPANGEGLLEVEVTTRLTDVFSRLGDLLKGGGLKMVYELDGNVKVANRKTPFPFSLKGDLMDALRQGT